MPRKSARKQRAIIFGGVIAAASGVGALGGFMEAHQSIPKKNSRAVAVVSQAPKKRFQAALEGASFGFGAATAGIGTAAAGGKIARRIGARRQRKTKK